MTEDHQTLHLRSFIFVALLLGGALPESRAQVPGQKALPAQSVHSRRNDVKPEDPTGAIIAAFNKYEVVGMDAAHVENHYFSQIVHAYLYLGPIEFMLAEPRSAEIFLDKDYMEELRRRTNIIGDPFLTNQTKPPELGQHFSPFLYVP